MATREEQIKGLIKELQDKIKTLSSLGPAERELADRYKLQLDALLAEAPERKEKEPMTMGEGGELILPATDEDWETSTSKFVTIPPGQSYVDLDIEMGMPDWDTIGKSIKFPVVVIAPGPDEGKEDKISGGAQPGKTFKTREIHLAVLGREPEYIEGQDGKKHPKIVPTEFAGKKATGHWEMQSGRKGGDPEGEVVHYPKLVSILPLGTKTEGLGI